jgi:MFS family permease
MLIGIITRSHNPWLYIGFACGYYASVGFTGPAWNSLMGDLTMAKARASYFGRRGGLSQLVLFLSMIAAGLILEHFDTLHKPFIGFGVIFAASFLSRTASVYTLTRHYEVPYKKVKDSYFSFYQFLARSPKSNFAHFVFFVSLMSFAVQVSAPFFATYMLRDLEFSYIKYTIAQGFYIVAQFLAMRRWGPFADRYGNRLVLRITSAIMPIVPILWLFSRHYYYIIGLQVLAGLTWGGWFLCTATFMFDAVTPPKRARCAAYLNFFNCIGIFAGAMLGGYISKFAPQTLITGVITIMLFSPLQFVFLLSGILRLIVVFIFMPTVHEVRDVEKGGFKEMFGMLTNVKHLPGLRYEPFHTFDTMENEGEREK